MRLLAPAAVLLAAACTSTETPPETERTVSPILTTEQARDEFTFAEPDVARVTHTALDVDLDFEQQMVSGTATLDIEAADGAEEIILDSNGLQIDQITAPDGSELVYEVGESVEGKGEPITVQIGDVRQIAIDYTSAEGADALQWLDPEQTAGGEHPFVFSQGQAINNRSWIPTQDSPGIRQTWEASVTAPQPLTVVMSGIEQGEPQEAGEGRREFTFAMDKPVAPYLIAIAAGDIAFRELGPRSGVWAEPEMLDRAANELVDTPAMIDAAEELYGEYRWGRYDMIVLPPAFPYGGMENPVMTFLTPTFIAGDRSLTGLIAHELAHSWSGNLVTYASWRDGWLNEGVTSYIESRISEEVFGEKRADQEYALSYASLQRMVEEQGEDNPVTSMRTPEGTSPFDTAGEAIYDKGTVFLRTVESIVGREELDAWLRSWFDRHAFEPATSEMFLADMRENLIGDNEELEEELQLDEWVYGTGIPDNVVRPPEDAFAEVDAAAETYAEDGTLDAVAWNNWTTAEKMRFMRSLPDELPDRRLSELDDALDLTETGNNEVKFLWLQLALQNRYEPALPAAELFLKTVGRNKFVEPLFEALVEQGDWGQRIARRIYSETRPLYHSYTRNQVDPLVGVDEAA